MSVMSYNVTLRSTFDVSRSDVASSAFLGTQTFWGVTPFSLVRVSRRFDQSYCTLLHGLLGIEHLKSFGLFISRKQYTEFQLPLHRKHVPFQLQNKPVSDV
jgi:hypothetical protein